MAVRSKATLGMLANPVRSPAGWVVTHNAVTVGGPVEVVVPDGCNALLLVHNISGQTLGGFATVEDRWISGTAGILHGKGTNIKSTNQTVSYSSLFEGVSDTVGIVLNRTDGTHTVRVLPLRV